MTLGRGRALVAAIVVIIVAAAFAVAAKHCGSAALGPRPAAQRPRLLLLTSLPLVFSEDFSLNGNGSPSYAALQTRYRMVLISATSEPELVRGRLLLMAQPQAQTPENLVALDAWVRGGGRVLLLADPLLEWPSKRPLGDMLRPPEVFADTGLLAHWGLRLDPPTRRGAAMRSDGGVDVLTVSPGTLSGSCDVSRDKLVARCRIGRGRATVVADADLLDTARLGPHGRRNLDSLLRELAELEHP